jgi:hypothetical protein
VEKYCSSVQVTDEITAHASCMPDTKAYRHIQYVTLTTFSTVSMVSVTCLTVAMYILFSYSHFIPPPFCVFTNPTIEST